jgi:cytoskeletal protein RodZ
VAAPVRSTRENLVAAAPGWVTEDPWETKKPSRKRLPLLLAGAGALVVAALVAVFALLPTGERGNPSAVANDKRDAPTQTLSEAPPSSPVSITSSSAPPSSVSSAAPSSTTTTASATPSATTTQAVPPPVKPTTTAPPTTTTPTWQRTTVTRYQHSKGWHVTASPAFPAPSGFTREYPLGDLSVKAAPGARKLYSCKQNTSDDHFSSTDQSGACEGHQAIGLLGYIFTAPPEGARTASLYRCTYAGGHFDSIHADCEGFKLEFRLGYLLI